MSNEPTRTKKETALWIASMAFCLAIALTCLLGLIGVLESTSLLTTLFTALYMLVNCLRNWEDDRKFALFELVAFAVLAIGTVILIVVP